MVALLIGGIETLGLIGGEVNLQGWFWHRMADLNNNFCTLGYGIIALFAVSWAISLVVYRVKKLDDIEVVAADQL